MGESERVIATGAYDKVGSIVREAMKLPGDSGYHFAIQSQKSGLPARRELVTQLGNDVRPVPDICLVVEDRVPEKDHMAG
ncbi:MAG: hypothetical protein JWO49_2535 [Arthrobacter sp.]|nr:hypothetical protein [Arthrobacter sp.]